MQLALARLTGLKVEFQFRGFFRFGHTVNVWTHQLSGFAALDV
jgi:hypothetical protein